MKKTLSKILSVLLAITVISGVMAIGASAVDSDTLNETDVYVAGTLVSEGYYLVADGGITAENASASNYNVKFTPATESANAKLTLNNAKNIYQTVEVDSIYSVVLSGGALDVELLGENTFINGNVAFESMGDISFVGSGSISFSSNEEYGYFTISASNISVGDAVQINLNTPELQLVHGFYTENGTVTIKENASVNMKITGMGIYSAGLTVCDNARLTVDTAEIAYLAAEIYGDVDVSDNAVVNLSTARKIFGYVVVDVYNYALCVKKGNVSVSDKATLNAIAGDGEQSIGIYSKGNIVASGDAKVNAKSGNTSRVTLGIFIDYATKDTFLLVSDNAQVTAESGEISGGDDIYPYNNGFASGGIEATNVIVRGNAKLTGIGGSATDLDEGSVQNDCGGIYVADRLLIEDHAVVKGVGGTAKDISGGVFATGIFIEPTYDAKLEGVSGRSNGSSIAIQCQVLKAEGGEVIGTANTSVSAASCGIKTGSLLADSSTFKATASSGNTSFGIYAELTELSGYTSVNAKSAEATVTSCGLYSEIFTSEQEVNINAIGGSAEWAYGLAVEEATITDDTVIDAQAGDGIARSAGIYMYNLGTVNGNAKLTVTAGKAEKEYSAGIYSNGSVNIGGNAKVISTADTADKSHGLAIKTLTVSGNAYVEAIGEKSAIFSTNEINPEGYTDPYIIVSDGTDLENASEWDGTTALGGESSPYKYVLIAPEAPEEPELSFFEKLIADITAFFKGIIEFFASLFSF